jgi:hypothetical protein
MQVPTQCKTGSKAQHLRKTKQLLSEFATGLAPYGKKLRGSIIIIKIEGGGVVYILEEQECGHRCSRPTPQSGFQINFPANRGIRKSAKTPIEAPQSYQIKRKKKKKRKPLWSAGKRE